MDAKKKEFLDFLDNRKNEVQNEVNELMADERADEGNVLKAKVNVYDIAKAFYGAAEKVAGTDGLADNFKTKFGNVANQWNTALEKAKEHDDSYKVLIEEAKQSAVSEILKKFDELMQ